jgi:hypothetical protein
VLPICNLLGAADGVVLYLDDVRVEVPGLEKENGGQYYNYFRRFSEKKIGG